MPDIFVLSLCLHLRRACATLSAIFLVSAKPVAAPGASTAVSLSSCTGQGFFRVVVEAGIETVQSLSGSADMIVVGGALMEWCRRRFAPSEMSLEVLLISRMVVS
jgi:hypothetical protein